MGYTGVEVAGFPDGVPPERAGTENFDYHGLTVTSAYSALPFLNG